MPEAKAIIDQLRHQGRLHAKAACLYRVIRFASDIDDAVIFQMDFEPAKGITELASAIDNLVRLECRGLASEFKLWLTQFGRLVIGRSVHGGEQW
jgi:hypothetical protein